MSLSTIPAVIGSRGFFISIDELVISAELLLFCPQVLVFCSPVVVDVVHSCDV